MRRASRGRILLIALLIGSWSSPAFAQDVVHEDRPDVVHSFRLIRSRSSLEQTGGFAGVNLDYDLFGRFQIRTGFEPSPLAVYPPIFVPFAQFEDTRVFAFNNHPAVDAFPFPLERIIDLEELRGTFRPGEPRRLFFRGEDHQGEPFQLLAVQRGRLLHLLGESREQCCDFFHYKIDALAHIAPYADFDLDGVVDRSDLDRLLGNMGMAADASLEDGDADGDGDVDGDDFLTWQRQVGESVNLSEFAGDSLADFNLTSAAVPEPASIALALSCFAPLLFYRRLRRK